MKLTNLIEHLYVKIYVAIVEQGVARDVSIEIVNGSDVSKEQHFFESEADAREYIEEIISESPYYYVALLNSAKDQGAVPSCQKLEMRSFADTSLSKILCMDEQWALYSAKTELNAMQRSHSSYGLDFIFSPFSILHRFFSDKIDEVMGLYVLVQEESLSIAVFSPQKLEFAQHLYIDPDEMELAQVEEENMAFNLDDHDEDDINLDDLEDIDSLDEIEALDDIESLDDIDDVESFEDFTEDEEVEQEVQAPSKEEEIEGFNIDFHRYTLIQQSLQRYYSDEKYNNTFVEAVFIADAVGVSSDLKNYLEEELFITPILRKIELSDAVLELCHEEIDSAS